MKKNIKKVYKKLIKDEFIKKLYKKSFLNFSFIMIYTIYKNLYL